MAASSTDIESVPMTRAELQAWTGTVCQLPVWPTNYDYPCLCCNTTLGSAYTLIQHWQDSWSRTNAKCVVDDAMDRRLVAIFAGWSWEQSVGTRSYDSGIVCSRSRSLVTYQPTETIYTLVATAQVVKNSMHEFVAENGVTLCSCIRPALQGKGEGAPTGADYLEFALHLSIWGCVGTEQLSRVMYPFGDILLKSFRAHELA